MEKIQTDKHIDDVTLGEVEALIKNAYINGWEGEDGFLLAVSLKY